MSEVRNQNIVDGEKRSPPPSVPPGDDATVMPRLVDVPVLQLLQSLDSALNRARQRVIAERGLGDQNYAAHGSSPVA